MTAIQLLVHAPKVQKLTIVQRLPAEEAQAVEVEQREAEQEIFVKEEQDHAGDTGIGPAAMHQQESLQVPELGNAEVAAHHSLHAFLTTNAHSCTHTHTPLSPHAAVDHDNHDHSKTLMVLMMMLTMKMTMVMMETLMSKTSLLSS